MPTLYYYSNYKTVKQQQNTTKIKQIYYNTG